MKKFTAFILAVLMLLSFTACSGEGDEITTEEPTQSDEAPAHTDEETKEYDPRPISPFTTRTATRSSFRI